MGERVSMDTDLLNGLADAIANKFDEDVPLTVGQQTNIINAITKRSSSDLTYSGATVRAPAGYYSTQASKTIPSSDSTPSLIVGQVSSHEVTITPSVVTNTGGYISSGTITNNSGARTITAEQLVSGSITISSSGTTDVGVYKNAVVPTGSTAPSLIRGQISNNEITITPSVINTAGFISSGTVTDVEGAETITASDLVSGNITIESSGTTDVTNYKNALVGAGSVSVSYIRSQVSNHSVSIIPRASVSKGYVPNSSTSGEAAVVTASELVSGNYHITANGTGIDVANYATVSVALPSDINNQDKTVDPSTSIVYVNADSGYSGLGTVTVNAMPSLSLPLITDIAAEQGYAVKSVISHGSRDQYINIGTGYNASGAYYKINAVATMTLPTTTQALPTADTEKLVITRNTSDRYLNFQPGYNSESAYYTIKGVPNGSVTVPASISGTASSVTVGTNTLTFTGTIEDIKPRVTTAGYISSSGGTAGDIDVTLTASVSTRSSSDLTASGATVTAPAGYYASNATKTIASGSASVPNTITSVLNTASVTGVDTTNNVITVSGTKASVLPVISAGYISSGTSANVTINVPIVATILSSATAYTPSETTQTILNNAGILYAGGAITINPIPSQYIVPSGNIQIIGSGTTDVTEYATASVDAGSATIQNSISGTGAAVSVSLGKLTFTKTLSLTPEVTPGYISVGTTNNNVSVSLTSNVISKTAATYYPSTTPNEIPSGTYLSGKQTIEAVVTQGISKSNIKHGVVVKVGDDTDNSRIIEVTGEFTKASTVSQNQTAATAAQILSGYSAWVDGAEVKGNIATKTSDNLSVDGSTVTAPAGYYATSASASVESMTLPTETSLTHEGTSKASFSITSLPVYLNIPRGWNSSGAYYTISAPAGIVNNPTATKGTVNNHAITVTPKVTSTTGYQIGTTKTGTAVTVSASELVSGDYTIDDAGEHSVGNYATATVAAGSAEAPSSITGTSASLSVSAGTPGSITLSKTVSVTPTVSEGYIKSGSATNSSVSLTASMNVYSPRTITPTTSAQMLVQSGAAVFAGPFVIGAIPSQYIVPSGNIDITSSGETDVTSYATATVSAITLPTESSASHSGSAKATIYPTSSTRYLNITSGYNASGAYYTIPAVALSNLSAANIKTGVTVKVGDSADDDRIASVTGTFTSSSTVSSGQTAAAAAQILSGYSAWVNGAEVKGNISTITLPDTPTTTYLGTKITNVTPNETSITYINIPAGYNATASYYQIPKDVMMTLPTTTGTSHLAIATYKATITPTNETRYLNIPVGRNAAYAYYTIDPGMVFETGTWTPSADIAKGSISFSNTHTVAPYCVHIFDQTQTTPTTNSISNMIYTDAYQMFGDTVPYSSNFRYGFVYAAYKTDSGGNVYMGTLQYPSTNTGNSSTAYPRFWVTESGFNPYSGSDARYWRSGRTYKWIAIWK